MFNSVICIFMYDVTAGNLYTDRKRTKTQKEEMLVKRRKKEEGKEGGRRREKEEEGGRGEEGGGGLGRLSYLQEENILREPLDWFEEEALQTEAGLALVILSSEERDKFGLLLDCFL